MASAHSSGAGRAHGARVGGMSDDTSGTSTDPELDSEGDTDQLHQRGHAARPRRRRPARRGLHRPRAAPVEPLRRDAVGRGAPRDDRPADRPGGARGLGGPAARPTREEFRAGRLVEDDDAVEAGGTDGFAIDAGHLGRRRERRGGRGAPHRGGVRRRPPLPRRRRRLTWSAAERRRTRRHSPGASVRSRPRAGAASAAAAVACCRSSAARRARVCTARAASSSSGG